MRRLVALVAALAVTTAACGGSGDRDRPRFAMPRIFAAPVGPVVLTVGPDDVVYYAELRTYDVYSVRRGELPTLLFHSLFKPDSLAVGRDGAVFVAARSMEHRLYISRFQNVGPDSWVQPLVWVGGRSRFPAHIAIEPDELLVGWHTRLFRLDPRGESAQDPVLITKARYTDPVFTRRGTGRIWVADNALPGRAERVDNTELPPYTNPSGIVVRGDDLFVCSRTHHKVYRLRIHGDRAEWRGQVGRVACDRDIGVLTDGSLITAQTSAVYRYPPR